MKYLVNNRDEKQVYYFKRNRGICCTAVNTFPNESVVMKEGTDNFFVYRTNDAITHLIAEDINGRLVYMACKNKEWRSYIIGSPNQEIKIKRMMIGTNRVGQSLFYSALYNNEYILVHCVLGDRAMPQTIAKLADENFVIHKSAVYYANSQGIIGYQSFWDGKPEKFVAKAEGKMPYTKSIGNKTYLVYKNENNICVNNKIVCEDALAFMPILANDKNAVSVVWQSAERIKQIPLFNEEQAAVKSSVYGQTPDMFVMSDGTECSCYYGQIANGELKVFYSNDPFSENDTDNAKKELSNCKEETLRLKKIIEQLKQELTIYKNELIKLNEALKKETQTEEFVEKSE